MKRRTFLSLALCAVAARPAGAGISTNAFTIAVRAKKRGLRDCLVARKESLSVEDPPKEVDWYGKPAPGRWYVNGPRITATVGGKYLAYDPAGKDPRVFLSTERVAGTEWDVSLKDGRAAEGARAVIRAAKGPMRGWYLSVEAVEEKGERGRAVKVRRAVLAKDPTEKLEAERIFEHK